MTTSHQRTIVVTGVAGRWGRQVARHLLTNSDLRVLGIDRRSPDREQQGLDFIKADIRNPLLVDLLRVERVDTVIHLAFRERQWRHEPDFDSNVLGTRQLVGACADAGVRQVVIKSTMAVYGARADNPMYVGEDWPLRAQSAYAYVRDALDIERFLPKFRSHYPELRVAILRFPGIVGPDMDTPLTRMLELPLLPYLLGFDPLLQVIGAKDVVRVLCHTATVEADGPHNIAADGVLSLWQLAGLAGRPPLPLFHPLLYGSWPLMTISPVGRRILAWFPIEPDYLRYPWTGDLTRMREALQFVPRQTALEAVMAYVQARRIQPFQDFAERRTFAQDRLDEVVGQREEAWQVSTGSQPEEAS